MKIPNWYKAVSFALILPTGFAQNPVTDIRDKNGNGVPNYSPVRPPAVPLAVRSPYTSFWSTTSEHSTLNTLSPRFVSTLARVSVPGYLRSPPFVMRKIKD